jgi:hypothetical protein
MVLRSTAPGPRHRRPRVHSGLPILGAVCATSQRGCQTGGPTAGRSEDHRGEAEALRFTYPASRSGTEQWWDGVRASFRTPSGRALRGPRGDLNDMAERSGACWAPCAEFGARASPRGVVALRYPRQPSTLARGGGPPARPALGLQRLRALPTPVRVQEYSRRGYCVTWRHWSDTIRHSLPRSRAKTSVLRP